MPSAYQGLVDIVESLGGRMVHVRKGQPSGGRWIVSLPGFADRPFDCDGKGGAPELDRLYVPKVPSPKTYRDYTNTLLPTARESLLAMLRPQ
jgi:hypothetical protein